MKRLLGISVAVLLVACAQKSADSPNKATGADAGGKGKDRKLSVAAYIAHPMTLQQAMLGIGTLLPAEQAEIKSEIAGRIASIEFREGQYVDAGARLLKIADDELQANRAKALAKRDYLKSVLARKQKQLELDAVSKQDIELSESDLAGAEADLRLLDAQLAKTEIRAPFAGVLGLRNVSPGAVLSAGQSITTLVKKYPIKLEFSVTASMAPYAKVGTPIEILVEGDKTITGRVFATEGTFNTSNRSMLVRATIEKGGDLAPGTAVEVSIPKMEQSAFLIPPDALSGNIQGPIVFVIRDHKVAEVPVVVGIRTATQVQIRTGLTDGDTVLCMGAQPLRKGTSVNISEIRQ